MLWDCMREKQNKIFMSSFEAEENHKAFCFDLQQLQSVVINHGGRPSGARPAGNFLDMKHLTDWDLGAAGSGEYGCKLSVDRL